MTEQEWRASVDARLSEFQRRISVMETGSAVEKVIAKNVEKRLGAIESGQTWIIRLVVAAIILGLLNQLMQAGGGL